MSVEQIILQGGALTAICIIAYMVARHLTLLNKRLFEETYELVTNHIKHNTEALLELKEAILALCRRLNENEKNQKG